MTEWRVGSCGPVTGWGRWTVDSRLGSHRAGQRHGKTLQYGGDPQFARFFLALPAVRRGAAVVRSGMTTYLITGGSGFVAYHFLERLVSRGAPCRIHALDKDDPFLAVASTPAVTIEYRRFDLLQKERLVDTVREIRPDYVLNLASFSSVAASWRSPDESFQNNTGIFLHLLEAVRSADAPCRILSIGSSEEYGDVDAVDLPLTEAAPLRPTSPYAVSRVSQELLSKLYVDALGLDIILTRSFNHFGPHQRDNFVLASFASQIVRQRRAGGDVVLDTGDIGVIRDFIDVRDVVSAYLLLFEKGRKGDVYNVCSGTGHSLEEVIGILARLAGTAVRTRQNPELVRPRENRVVIGSNAKLRHATGWRQTISLEQGLEDLLQYWESR